MTKQLLLPLAQPVMRPRFNPTRADRALARAMRSLALPAQTDCPVVCPDPDLFNAEEPRCSAEGNQRSDGVSS